MHTRHKTSSQHILFVHKIIFLKLVLELECMALKGIGSIDLLTSYFPVGP